MKNKTLLMVLFGAVLILSGCAYYSLVETGRKVEVGQGMWVEPVTTWNKAKERGAVIWTADGPSLQEIFFFTGIKEGESLLKPRPGQDSEKMPKYRAGMTFLEIVDFLEASLAGENVHQFEKRKVQPSTIGGREGFRLEFSYVAEEGLDYNGIAAGAVKDSRLYMVMYVGTSLHYYGQYAEQVNRIIDSVEFL